MANNNPVKMDDEIWEGWTAEAFVEHLRPLADIIQRGESWRKPFKTYEELAAWCTDNQPYYKERIDLVVDYFARRYAIRKEAAE